jgi:hypothetical protein
MDGPGRRRRFPSLGTRRGGRPGPLFPVRSIPGERTTQTGPALDAPVGQPWLREGAGNQGPTGAAQRPYPPSASVQLDDRAQGPPKEQTIHPSGYSDEIERTAAGAGQLGRDRRPSYDYYLEGGPPRSSRCPRRAAVKPRRSDRERGVWSYLRPPRWSRAQPSPWAGLRSHASGEAVDGSPVDGTGTEAAVPSV